MRSGLFLPLFDELADPAMVARLSAEAEEAGWHGVFVWDQVRWEEPIIDVADPQITLAAIATATERIRAKAQLLAGAALETEASALTWEDGVFVGSAGARTIADLALYAHGTGDLPPGVEGGLDAQAVYQ